MRMMIGILAALTVLVVGCDINSVAKVDGMPLVTIQRVLSGYHDVYTSVTSKAYQLRLEERTILFQCPCYLGDERQNRSDGGSVAVITAGEMKVELLPRASYVVQVREVDYRVVTHNLSSTEK